MLVIDFEAAGFDGHPIEVAWCAADLSSAWSTVIRPLPHWDAWSTEAEQMHGLTREDTLRGLPVADVMERLNDDLPDEDMITDNPGFDEIWLTQLARAAGVQPMFFIDPYPLDSRLDDLCREAGLGRYAGEAEMHGTALAQSAGLLHHRALDDCIRNALKLAVPKLLTLSDADAFSSRADLADKARRLISTHGRRP